MSTEHASSTVLVTGAGGGIGRATALRLANLGWQVFAGNRTLGDGMPVHPNITPVKLDVADFSSIGEASVKISKILGDRGLDGLVNHEGITCVAPMEHVTPSEIHRLFEVNIFGVVATTQAFLSLIRKSRGRIVNISSLGAMTTVPFGGAVCATKRALESITEAFRLELMPSGIRVIMIRPTSIDPAAIEHLPENLDDLIEGLPEEGRQRYGADLHEFLQDLRTTEQSGSPPEVVAEAILGALIAEHPHPSYVVGHNSHLLPLLQKWVPQEMQEQLKADQESPTPGR